MSEDLAILRSVTHDGPAGATTPPGPAPEVASDAGQAPDPRAAVMARPRRGTLRRRQTTQGVSYTVQFSYRGEEHYVYLGGSWEGWTEQRAVEEQGYLMAKVNRGEWTPAPRERAPGARRSGAELPARRLGVAAPPPAQGRRPGRALQDEPRPALAPLGGDRQVRPRPRRPRRLRARRRARDRALRGAPGDRTRARAGRAADAHPGRPAHRPDAIGRAGAASPTRRSGGRSMPPSASCATPRSAASSPASSPTSSPPPRRPSALGARSSSSSRSTRCCARPRSPRRRSAA